MKKNILLLIILSLGFSCSINNQSLKDNTKSEIDSLVTAIAAENILNDEGIGIAWEKNAQWERYLRLVELATEQDLVMLTNHENAVVRGYSFQGLAKNRSSHVFPILLKHLSDTTAVETFSGCFQSIEMLGDYLINIVSVNNDDTTAYKLSPKEQTSIDSILLFDKSVQLHARTSLLIKLKPKDEYYSRIKEIVLEGNESFALPMLAKYQQADDRQLIIDKLTSQKRDNWYYGLMSVRNYPDPIFFPYLVNLYNYEMSDEKGLNIPSIRMLYQAIVQYKNKPSYDLIKQTLSKGEKPELRYHYEYIYLALTKYPDKIYNGLKEQIKLTDLQLHDMEYSIGSET